MARSRGAIRAPRGIAPGDQAGQHICEYNDVASLEAAVATAGKDIAAIFAAPYRHDVFVDQASPAPEYARRARELADETGALLIIDEVRAGFRIARDSQLVRDRRRAGPVVLGQVHRQRPSHLRPAGVGEGARRGHAHLRHRLLLVRRRRDGRQPQDARS